MPVSSAIGRIVVFSGELSRAQQISEYLSYKGIDAVICRSEDDASYFIAVIEADKDEALAIIKDLEESDVKAKSSLKNSPTFTFVAKKLDVINNSSYLFIICGGIVIVLALLRLLRIIATEGVHDAFLIAELVLGVFFFLFGLRIFVQSIEAKKRLSKETAYTLEVINWFLSTYTPEDLDKLAEAEEGESSSPSELRRGIICRSISREFDIDDKAYLDYLTDEVYIAMYHKRKLR